MSNKPKRVAVDIEDFGPIVITQTESLWYAHLALPDDVIQNTPEGKAVMVNAEELRGIAAAATAVAEAIEEATA